MDSSALVAIVLGEPSGPPCMAALESDDELIMSAGTLAESLIVAGRRGMGQEMARLIEGLGVQVLDVNSTSAAAAADAYRRWGKGWHAAGLNYGDCFAYELAARSRCPLLFVGGDFSKTDIASAL